jgi:glycosyltransferase involved in cell wall biosynthesis
MQWMLDNPEQARAMGRRGRAAVEQRYTWEREAEKLVGLYADLLGRKKKA